MAREKNTKFTAENRREIIRLVKAGLSTTDVAKAVGIHPSTLFNWLSWGEDGIRGRDDDEEYVKFAHEYRRAEAMRKAFHLQNITRAANDGQWQASAWYLERAYPQEFGRCQRKPDDGNEELLKAIKDMTEAVRSSAVV